VTDALLQVEALEAGYDDVQVLWGISLKVERGAMTTLVGTNGAGKTTSLRAITGSIRPHGGRVLFEGEDVTRLSPHAKTARGLVLVPEGRQLFSEMSVEENLEMGAYSKRARRQFQDQLDRVYTLFPRLKERRAQKAGTFSGGEQQMLAIGRGLMCIHPVGAAGMALSEATAPPCQAARATGIARRQFHGSSAARSVILWSAIRANTSASQAWGSMSLSLAV